MTKYHINKADALRKIRRRSVFDIFTTPHPQFPIDYLIKKLGGIEELVATLPRPNGLIFATGVTWLQDLDVLVGVHAGFINGVLHSNEETELTHDEADPVNPRIDLYVLTDQDEVQIIAGTPAADPQKPAIDPATMLEITFKVINAQQTDFDEGIEVVFDENEEWEPSTNSGSVNFNATNLPYRGLINIDVTIISNNHHLTFTSGETHQFSEYTNHFLNIRLKAIMEPRENLYIQFFLDDVDVSNEILLPVNKSLAGEYQLVGVNINNFELRLNSFNRIRIRWSKQGPQTSHQGFFMDYIRLEKIFTPPIVVTDHNSLAGLQGGVGAERYHLRQNEHATLTQFAADANDPVTELADADTLVVRVASVLKKITWQNFKGLLNNLYLKLDQTVHQVITGGIPRLHPDREITDAHELIDKAYLGQAVTALGKRLYLLDEIIPDTSHRLTSLTPSVLAEAFVEESGLADNDLVGTWRIPCDALGSRLITGLYNFLYIAERTSGTQSLRLYWTLTELLENETEQLIFTSADSSLITAKTKGQSILTLADDHVFQQGSCLLMKVYARVEGGGSAPTIRLYYQGTGQSHFEFPSNTELLQELFLTDAPQDGDTYGRKDGNWAKVDGAGGSGGHTLQTPDGTDLTQREKLRATGPMKFSNPEGQTHSLLEENSEEWEDLTDKLKGSLVIVSGDIKLDGDEDAPGNNKYYGTDASGTKGFHSIAEGGAVFDMANAINTATEKTTPVDADAVGIYDSVSEGLRKLTWANIKATLKSYFDTLYVALTGNQTVAGVKTFSSFPVTPSEAPTTDYQVANKKYVDDNAGGGGSGGHELLDRDGEALTQREKLKGDNDHEFTNPAGEDFSLFGFKPEAIEEALDVNVDGVPAAAKALLEDTANWDNKEYIGDDLINCEAGMEHHDTDYFFKFVTDTKPIRMALI